MLQKSPSSFNFQHVFPYQKNGSERREKSQNLSRQAGRRGQLPPGPQLGPEVSVPTVHDHSHSPTLVCGGGCAGVAVGNTLQGQDPSLRNESSQTTLSRVVIFSFSGVIPFFLLIKPKLKFPGLPFGE